MYPTRRAEFEFEWVPQAILIGISWDEFWNMTPRILRAYAKAEDLRRKRADQEAWLNGSYTHHAVMAALDKGFNGKKSKLNYLEKPYSEQAELQKQKADSQVKLLFASLEVMKSNYELNNKTKADSVS